MTALMWQTALVLLGAYFLGAWAACMVRKLLFSGRREEVTVPASVVAAGDVAPASVPMPNPPPRPVQAVEARPVVPVPPPPAPAVAEPADKFSRALSGQYPAEPRPAASARESASQGGMALPTPPDRSSSGVSTMVEAIRSRATETAEPAPSKPATDLAAAAAAVSRPTTPPPGAAKGPVVMPVAVGTGGPSSVSAPPSTPASPDDLTMIQGIDTAIQSRLHSAGVRRFAEIAAWKPEQVAAIAAVLGMPGRIERENWIEQAQMLAKGEETLYSKRRRLGEIASAEPMADEGTHRSVAPAASSGAGAIAAAAAAAALSEARAATVRSLRPAGPVRDNLQRIGGINAEVERMLNVQGVQRYTQIASWSPDDVAKFDRLLGQDGRIARENWIEQAQVLARGEGTAYSREIDRRSGEGAARPAKLADAIAARALASEAEPAVEKGQRSDLAVLRSVRSEAYKPADGGTGPRTFDDLKLIRGIGVLIEKKLNGLGITRYEQIANWAQDDIERYSSKLDFKGRIERESWVEQARILSTGGQTEFSRRLERGEVETSKKLD